jgi:hypothetical protein
MKQLATKQGFTFLSSLSHRLIEIAPHYYDMSNFPNCEAKRILERIALGKKRT